MLRLLLTAVSFAATTTALAGIPAEVTIDSGTVAGTTGGSPEIRVFKGIPFAAPPLGANRWRAPQPVAKWSGVRPATDYAPRCTQGGGRQNANAPPTSEDCLYLNVWTAAESVNDRRPVMVWIYGGGFSGGAGSEPRYAGDGLARKGAVVVTLNYRLGSLGFFAHPQLSAEAEAKTSGNYGMLDAVAALQWVQRNIAAFGGDPGNVTVFGESAGANMTGALVASPLAKDLFQRAISQ
ncbi:MAG TPA: carboxylesterase family protein, partial [Gammaproteobacteria bacterium]